MRTSQRPSPKPPRRQDQFSSYPKLLRPKFPGNRLQGGPQLVLPFRWPERERMFDRVSNGLREFADALDERWPAFRGLGFSVVAAIRLAVPIRTEPQTLVERAG